MLVDSEETQHVADGAMLGGIMRLVPPGSSEFKHYLNVGNGASDRAVEWATAHKFLLYVGPSMYCVHGLYRMDSCPATGACRSVGMDHTRIWVTHDARGAFILTHPYVSSIPKSIAAYGAMHALSVRSLPYDGWYNSPHTLPIRLSIPTDWPLWPICRDAAVVLHTQPIDWL